MDIAITSISRLHVNASYYIFNEAMEGIFRAIKQLFKEMKRWQKKLK
jgi:hypothetical protein